MVFAVIRLIDETAVETSKETAHDDESMAEQVFLHRLLLKTDLLLGCMVESI